MKLGYLYYCSRILSRIGGEDSTFRLIRTCIFTGIAFLYIFFFTRSYIERERENFVKNYNQTQILQIFKNLIKANHDGIVIT